jgi:hypothetical protein
MSTSEIGCQSGHVHYGHVGDRAGRAQDEPDEAQDHRVTHGIAGREACGDVAPGDGVDASIEQREEIQNRIAHRLTPWRIYAERVEHLVGAEGKNENRDESQEDCSDAAGQAARTFAPRCRRHAHRSSRATSDANISSSSL